ncbi:helix-turn-helix domain-containing protein [Cohnella cellulosilytica]|uniref:Helix-turn-helix domain-containing protein n=1 Tax=Cohnella cellulosilytica TaxID=986710 RepID=A0ABW2FHT1_9BACL
MLSLESLLFKLIDIQALDAVGLRSMDGAELLSPALFIVASGEGRWFAGRVSIPMKRGSVLLMGAGDRLYTTNSPLSTSNTMLAYRISFRVFEAADDGSVRTGDRVGPSLVCLQDFMALVDIAERIYGYRGKSRPLDRMRVNLWFQEMVLGVLERADDVENKRDAAQAVSLTTDFMERHYMREITREQLAAMAGMSANYYSRIFKNRTGKSPIEHLNEIRMKHAKRLLSFSNLSVGKIAQTIGYRDEFYFSRKFKEKIGASPTVFARERKPQRKIVSLSTAYTGHLMALGVEPYATLMHDSYPIGDHLRNTILLGTTVPDFSRIADRDIDLILCFESDDRRQLEALNRLAPTYPIPFHPMEWRDHLRTIGEIAGKEKEAELWLDKYDRKARSARELLARKIGTDSIAIVALGRDGLAVYGNRNMGAVLYGDLALTPAAGAADIYHFKMIAECELADYDADYMLVIGDGEETAEQWSALLHREPWSELTSVRKRQAYLADGRRWGGYNPMSHEWIVDDMLRMLTIQ